MKRALVFLTALVLAVSVTSLGPCVPEVPADTVDVVRPARIWLDTVLAIHYDTVFIPSGAGEAVSQESKTFLKVVGGAVASQDQATEKTVEGQFQIEGIVMVPWIPWHIGTTFRYWNTGEPGENEKEYSARTVIFSGDPNSIENENQWLGFATLGGVDFYDSEADSKKLTNVNFDGSIGIIVPDVISELNLVGEVGGRREAGKSYWWIGIGFFGLPKL